MLRWICILLLAALSLAPFTIAQTKYFPPDFPPAFYEKHLTALNEPSLWEASKGQKTQSYRLLWLRTFHHPIAVRVDLKADGTFLLTTKMSSGAGGYDPGKLIQDETLRLTREQTNWFLGQIEADNFLEAAVSSTRSQSGWRTADYRGSQKWELPHCGSLVAVKWRNPSPWTI